MAEELSPDENILNIKPGSTLEQLEYHEKLNVIFAKSGPELFILDPILGDVIYSTKICDESDDDKWSFSIIGDRVVILTKDRIGIRSEYNGIMLLETILQTPVTNPNDLVKIELSKTEAESLLQILSQTNDESLATLMSQTKKAIGELKKYKESIKDSPFSLKMDKWKTVVLEGSLSGLKSSFESIVSLSWGKSAYAPYLSLASSVVERLRLLTPTSSSQSNERSGMFSEANRLNSFLSWPHTGYKWALPSKMAQAGFYHSPSSTGEDRAMCFACNVCLISWEPNDEPWSEHERHSPFCPFVRGEQTNNVPLSHAFGTAPAIPLSIKNIQGQSIIGPSSCPNAFVTAYSNGQIIIYDTSKLAKEALSFEVTYEMFESCDVSNALGYCDIQAMPPEKWLNPGTFLNHEQSHLESKEGVEREFEITSVVMVSSGREEEKGGSPSVILSGNYKINQTHHSSFLMTLAMENSNKSHHNHPSQSDKSEEIHSSGTKKESEALLREEELICSMDENEYPDSMGENGILDSYDSHLPKEEEAPESGSSTPLLPPPPSSTISLVQKLLLPDIESRMRTVGHLLLLPPSHSKILVFYSENESERKCERMGSLNLVWDEALVRVDSSSFFSTGFEEIDPNGGGRVSSCLVPNGEGVLLGVGLSSGSVGIWNLELELVYRIMKLPLDPLISSLAYCSSSERLLCGSSIGELRSYPVGRTAEDEEHGEGVDVDELLLSSDSASDLLEGIGGESEVKTLLVHSTQLSGEALGTLYSLTAFESLRQGLSIDGPSAWQRIVQAQKERRGTLAEATPSPHSWRLQKTRSSKKEHLFEINFSKTVSVGYFEVKFLLHSGFSFPPKIELTLYRGRKMTKMTPESRSKRPESSSSSKTKTSEFLKSMNGEIVCGPLSLENYLDLSGESGTVVMTSPLLLLSKSRNFYLHLKAKSTTKEKSSTSSESSKRDKTREVSKEKIKLSTKKGESSGFISFIPEEHKSGLSKYFATVISGEGRGSSSSERRRDLGGCDWINEISISVKVPKVTTDIPNAEAEKKILLTSSTFLKRLLDAAVCKEREYDGGTALDLLVWIGSVCLCGPQLGKSAYQAKFIQTVKSRVEDLVLQCILLGGRSIAHKTTKLLVLCVDVLEMESKGNSELSEEFLDSLLNTLLSLLPTSLNSPSCGSLSWFFLLLNRVKGRGLHRASGILLPLLHQLSGELRKRADPYHSLLRTRFGLYGTPLEPDLFGIEVPGMTNKSPLHPLSYPALITSSLPSGPSSSAESPLMSSGLNSSLWGLRDIDFRDLLRGNNANLDRNKIGVLGPKQQVQGLLEVEPLHFTSLSCSEGTRVEKIDMGMGVAYSPMPMPHFQNEEYLSYAFIPSDSSKKTASSTLKSEQAILLKHLNKLNTIKIDEYYEYLNELKFLDTVSFEGSGGSADYSDLLQKNLTLSQNVKDLKAKLFPNSNSITTSIAHAPSSSSSSSGPTNYNSAQSGAKGSEEKVGGVSLSPFSALMSPPPPLSLSIDRLHSGARRWGILDFGSPVILTDFLLPPCSDAASLTLDMWLEGEGVDGVRLLHSTSIGKKGVVVGDMQPPPILRYLKITVVGRYGMTTTKCRIPLGLFYGHTSILPSDVKAENERNTGRKTPIQTLTPTKINAHLSILSYVVEDIGCRYELACSKLKKLLSPLLRPHISPLDHFSYYIPKGRERNKLGLNTPADQSIISAYQECVTLQQQLNVSKNVVRRLEGSLAQKSGENKELVDPLSKLNEVSTDKIYIITEHLIESLLGITLHPSLNSPINAPYSHYSSFTQEVCGKLFESICVRENSQVQLSTCALLLRSCGFQPWWGNFIASTLKNLFSSSNTLLFPQDRVFILLVFLGQKAVLSGGNYGVIESILELVCELCKESEIGNGGSGLLRCRVDTRLLGWTLMYLSLSLDALTPHSSSSSHKGDKERKESFGFSSSRWDFIQGESSLLKKQNGPSKSSGLSGMKRRMQKKTSTMKQKVEELDKIYNGSSKFGTIGNQFISLGQTLDSLKQSGHKIIGLQTAKEHIKELLQNRRNEVYRRSISPSSSSVHSNPSSLLALNPALSSSSSSSLSSLLLSLDSTAHSDLYLIICKTLSVLATTSLCPPLPLSGLFSQEGVEKLLERGVGAGDNSPGSWAPPWVSHAILCLLQDLLQAERLYGQESCIFDGSPLIETEEESPSTSQGKIETELLVLDESQSPNQDVFMSISPKDDGKFEFPDSPESPDSSDMEIEIIQDSYSSSVPENKPNKKMISSKNPNLVSCLAGISNALDSRLESGVDSLTELRLRQMAINDSKVLNESFSLPFEAPAEIISNLKPVRRSEEVRENINSSGPPSLEILSNSFNKLFNMLPYENCTINIEKLLQFWIALNLDIISSEDSSNTVPKIPLSLDSIKSLMLALTRNSGIGLGEWGLGFQCLTLAANQKSLNSETGDWLPMLKDPNFNEMILKFISGTGLNLHKNNTVSAGPTVCEHFNNFLLRMRHLSIDSPWSLYYKELLLRILSSFLSGPFLNSQFPLDAFSKFLDRVSSPDLSYSTVSTLVSIIANFTQSLHLYVFFPCKLMINGSVELKGTANGPPNNNSSEVRGKGTNLESLMMRLTSLVHDILNLVYKHKSSLTEEQEVMLNGLSISTNTLSYSSIISKASSFVEESGKFGNISDIILHLQPTMSRLFSLLAHSSSKSSFKIQDEMSRTFGQVENNSSPKSLVDSLLRIFFRLITLSHSKYIVKSLAIFLNKSPNEDFSCPLIISEPFIIMVLRVIEDRENLLEFINLNCIESVCKKLVECSKKFLSSSPTFISILNQYIGRSESSAIFGPSKSGNELMDLEDGLINVAPLGVIRSSNFGAHVSEALLSGAPAREMRRRTPVWSYHFYPEETHLDLIITLPCPVLLKEIHIIPHLPSLSSSSPCGVMVEISSDSSSCPVPLGPPLPSSGVSPLHLTLGNSGLVAQLVLLRLFKPSHSSTLGLSQIRLLGSTAFSTPAYQALCSTHSPYSQPNSCWGWMCVVERGVVLSGGDESVKKSILESAIAVPEVIESCYSLLLAPLEREEEGKLPHYASLLLHFGTLTQELSLHILNSLLHPVHSAFSTRMSSTINVQSSLSASFQLNIVTELLYKLCVEIPEWGIKNLSILLQWIETCADEALTSTPKTSCESNVIVPEYIQAISAALWTLKSTLKHDLAPLATSTLLWKLYQWSIQLGSKNALKDAIDHMLCSLCYTTPHFYVLLMYKIGILKPLDSKEDEVENELESWVEDNSVFERLVVKDVSSIIGLINGPMLLSLGRAAQSPPAYRLLHNSMLIGHLNTAIMDFWNYYTSLWMNGGSKGDESSATSTLSPCQLVSVLNFYSTLSRISEFRSWSGVHGSLWWLPLLTLLSSLPSSLKTSFFSSFTPMIENSTIQLLGDLCWAHPTNQRTLGGVLTTLIRTQKQPQQKAVFLHSISSFCRRLLIQVLLENEKMVVHVKNLSNLKLRAQMNSLELKDRHPSMGVCSGDRVFYVHTDHTPHDIIKILGSKNQEPVPVSGETSIGTSSGVKTKEDKSGRSGNSFSKENGVSFGAEEDDIHIIQYLIAEHEQAEFENSEQSGLLDSNNKKILKKALGKKLKAEENASTKSDSVSAFKINLEVDEFPGVKVPSLMSLRTIKASIIEMKPECFLDIVVLNARKEQVGKDPFPIYSSSVGLESSPSPLEMDNCEDDTPTIFSGQRVLSTVEEFGSLGGLGLIAPHLPLVYPETLRQMEGGGVRGAYAQVNGKDSPQQGGSNNEWVKVENAEEFYDEMMESIGGSSSGGGVGVVTKTVNGVGRSSGATSNGTVIPPHSMAAFTLFLPLPHFSTLLLRERVGAQAMLRLALGLTDDPDGNEILASPIGKHLGTLPFNVLKVLLDTLPCKSEDGKKLREVMFESQVLHFILACLAIFTHQTYDNSLPLQHELVLGVTRGEGESGWRGDKCSDDKSHVYWAKGTGFGTGSTQENWSVERAMERRRREEENVTSLLHLISSFIHPTTTTTSNTITNSNTTTSNTSNSATSIISNTSSNSSPQRPTPLEEFLKNSCLFPAISVYLKNDSVLDMARHVPLYKSVLKFLRSLVLSLDYIHLLGPNNKSEEESISTLLLKMKDIVDSYYKRLTSSKGKSKGQSKGIEDLEDEELSSLILDIQSTANIVQKAVSEYMSSLAPTEAETLNASDSQILVKQTLEERYLDEMKKLQFAFFDMISEDERSDGVKFTVSHFYESNIRTNWSRSAPARLKRLAQESITLSTSLPIAFGSSIFVRSDSDRLDVMKFLITGPSGTPYSNGCFEFDVYFPPDYPGSPMLIHLETTGRQRVRFNPNLYADGKVCLSILNTWHGRPEEKWNPQTSSLLPVLVAIQSLILNAEPYFNEPGYEKSRGTEGGERSNREYNSGIQIATLEWAMLDKLKHPSPCFKEVIEKHFWLKRVEIVAQCESWLESLISTCKNDKRAGKAVTGNVDPVSVFKNNLKLLKKELANMPVPHGLEDLDESVQNFKNPELNDQSGKGSSDEPMKSLQDEPIKSLQNDPIESCQNEPTSTTEPSETESNLNEMILSPHQNNDEEMVIEEDEFLFD